MVREDTFKITLLASLLIHTAALSFLPYLKNISSEKEFTKLEITYKGLPQRLSSQKEYGISKEILNTNPKKLPKTSLPFSPANTNNKKIEQPIKFDLSKLFTQKEAITIPKPQMLTQAQKSKNIKLKDISKETPREPAYINYKNKIRGQIREKVYYYSEQCLFFDNPRKGSIFVSFTINSNGILKELNILGEKSSNDELLKKIVLNAIKDASPFEEFPKELKYNERIINLEISFEIE